jgi:3-hydroxyisobutyrate dehydrogenase-like beta-hydroxyacid dehydrogenase
MTATPEPVAFLGVGTMGHAMATSALRAAIPTIVWNREPGPTRDLEALGADIAETAADAARLDAPVSGSKDPAEQGQLIIFASGPDEARPRVTPLFDALGQRTIWVGPVGAGSRLKLVNNTWLAFASESVATSI